MKKRVIGIILALSIIFSAAFAIDFTASAAGTTVADVSAASDLQLTGANYGLASKVEDGNILHCFNWTISQIKEELPYIAQAGFTSIQTSPLQNHTGWGGWYWLYQPTSFNVGNELGSYDDLKSLCTEAHRYGMKIIVDVVANHVAGYNDGGWSNDLDGSMRNSSYFHNQGSCDNWDNRYDVTHKNIGMPDLNTENDEVQNKILSLISAYKNAGVDGIRWDAAKHIGLPSEGCSLWSRVKDMGMYNYGEILDSPAGSSDAGYNSSLMAEYGSYIGVTDSTYSGTITGAVRDGRTDNSNGNWINRGVSASRIVYWAESHDTYCNNGWTNGLGENTIDRAYAIVGARANSQSLYLSRPYERNHESISTARKGSTHYTTKEVAAVNHFHNAMVGTGEAYTTGSGCYVICRGGGAVIVAASGSNFDVTVPNGNGLVPSGNYTDEVSGSTWTVSGSEIRGHIGDSGIAVIYNASNVPSVSSPSVSAEPGSTGYKTDTISVTLSVSNAKSASYSIDGGSFKSFTDGQRITIGSGKSYGTVTTLTVKASNSSETVQETYTYTKIDPNAKQLVCFDNSTYNWSNVNCYIYGDDGSNGDWPGVSMTRGSNNIFTYEVPDRFRNGKVLFTEYHDSSDHRYPAANKPGLELNGNSMIFGANNSWSIYTGSQPQPQTPEPTQTPTQKPTEPVIPTPTGKILVGDADMSGDVTILDATAIQRYLASYLTLKGNALASADADGDGNVTVLDATAIQRWLVKLPVSNNLLGKYSDGTPAENPTQPPVQEPTTPQPTVKPDGNSVILNASATSTLPEKWYAWTWSDGDGRWVAGVGDASYVIFNGLDSHVIFVRANPDMDVDWNNGSVWNQTGDLNTEYGHTFTTTGWGSRIQGSWN